MIRDSNAFLANNASVAAAAGTAALGTGAYDTTSGDGQTQVSGYLDTTDLHLVIRVRTGIITGGVAGTIQFQFVSAATLTITSSPNVHWSSPAFVTGATAAVGSGVGAGDVVGVVSVRGTGVIPAFLRYVGCLFIVGTTTTTAGNVDAFLTKDPGFWAALPEATQ